MMARSWFRGCHDLNTNLVKKSLYILVLLYMNGFWLFLDALTVGYETSTFKMLVHVKYIVMVKTQF